MAKRKATPTQPEAITSEGTIDNGKRSSGEVSGRTIDDAVDYWLYNEDTGELRLTRVRAGYAPAPMPFGFRVAKNEEIPGK